MTDPNFDPLGDTIDESQGSVPRAEAPRPAAVPPDSGDGVIPVGRADDDEFESSVRGLGASLPPRAYDSGVGPLSATPDRAFDSSARTLDSTAGGAFDSSARTLDSTAGGAFDSSARTLDSTAGGSLPTPPSPPPSPSDAAFDSSARTLDSTAGGAFNSSGATLDSTAPSPPVRRDRSTDSLLRDHAFRDHATIADGPLPVSNPTAPPQLTSSTGEPGASYVEDTIVETRAQPSGVEQSIGTRRVKRLKLPERSSKLPEQIGNYAPLRELGRGGMGVVYEAVHVRTERKAALKVLITPGGDASEVSIARFHVEARAAGRLKHPNIVAVLDQDLDPASAQWFLAMELVEGETLWDRVRRDGALDETRGVEMFVALADALVHAHGEQVLHRDLKPQNVILDAANDAPRLTDFGLAKLQGEDLNLTQDGPTLIGTPGFMPPEQAGTGIPIDHRADIYSLAATFYFALTGKPPFKAPSLPAVLNKVVNEAPEAPSKIVEGFSHDLETIVLKCLLKRPDDRYATAEELKADLLRFQAREAIEAKRLPPLVRLARWAQANVLAAVALSATSVALLAGLVFAGVVSQRHDEGMAEIAKLGEAVAAERETVAEQQQRVVKREEELSAKIDEIERTPPKLEIQQPALSEPGGEFVTASHEIAVRLWIPDEDLEAVTLNGVAVPASADQGYFELTWALEQEGKNIAELVATDANGNQTEASFVAIRDTTAPEFELELVEVPEVSSDPEAVAEVKVAVRLAEAEAGAAATLAVVHSQAGSNPVALTEAEPGLWEASAPLTLGANRLSVRVQDALGNERERARVVERLPRKVLRGAWWDLGEAQRAFALESNLPVVTDGGLGILFVLIPPGTFNMGSPPNEPGRQSNEDLHPVELSRGFYLSATEVTNAQLRAVFAGVPELEERSIKPATGTYVFNYDGKARGEPWTQALDGETHPAVYVSWEQATDFCRRLGQRMGRPRYRLPTEAEWEYAARGGTQSRWFWGEEPLDAAAFANVAGDGARAMLGLGNSPERGVAWFAFDDGAHPLVAPVGQFKPNPFGLYDMVGNAAEWCADFLAEYRLERDDAGGVRKAINPKGPDDTRTQARVFRGGSWSSKPPRTRVAFRNSAASRKKPWKSRTVGFRVVMDIVH